MPRFLLALPLGVLMVAAAQGRDDDPVKVKLDKAKAAFATEQEKFQQDIDAYFEKREEAARKLGEKKVVDQIKAERKAFEERGELPASAPKAAKQRLTTARTAMEKSYAAAIKEYTIAKNDDAATFVEKELTEFKKGLDPSDTRRQWVHDKGTFTHLGKGAWEEKSPDGRTYSWKETGRTKEYVELHAVIFDVPNTVRLTAKSAEYQTGKAAEFKPKFTGKWAN